VKTKGDLKTATTRVQELENTVAGLKSQLEELIQAKKSDESELLAKFRDLLNEKKVKIREQQQMLAVADVDQAAPIAPMRDPSVTSSNADRKPKLSRTSKRKAAQVVEPDDDSDDGPEDTEVGKKHGNEDSDDQQQTTDADETGSEPDDDEDVPMPDRPSTTAQKQTASRPATGPAASARQADAPPPKRSLPFGLGKASKNKPNTAADEGSDTEDDEL
jgi:hypothetical protein